MRLHNISRIIWLALLLKSISSNLFLRYFIDLFILFEREIVYLLHNLLLLYGIIVWKHQKLWCIWNFLNLFIFNHISIKLYLFSEGPNFNLIILNITIFIFFFIFFLTKLFHFYYIFLLIHLLPYKFTILPHGSILKLIFFFKRQLMVINNAFPLFLVKLCFDDVIIIVALITILLNLIYNIQSGLWHSTLFF